MLAAWKNHLYKKTIFKGRKEKEKEEQEGVREKKHE